ncbi:hypothetical protein [uncultured Muribaculum sp.]|uniref:hypothetical protein n=2 Tax=uncultured Muribaculum sp. TaxID=1918613 RepID=UPI00259C8435|nr:hypothetical protein [uncultured Muribaculum sp.]
MDILNLYAKWLWNSGITATSKSNSCYVSRLKKAIEVYDNSNGAFSPLINRIPEILSDKDSESIIGAIALKMTNLVENEYKAEKIGKGYRNDIFTAINRFELWLRDGINNGDFKGNQSHVNIESDKVKLKAELKHTKEFDIDTFRARIKNRLNSNRSKWPIRKFPQNLKWREQIADELLVLTECGIHKLHDLTAIRINDGILEVKPKIYQSDDIIKDRFIRVYSYRADGSIADFRVDENSLDPMSLISIEHSPAISLILKNGDFHELENLDNGRPYDEKKLAAEISNVIKLSTCMLMEHSENIKKNDKW